jgi:hypothetical protein
MLTRKTTLTVGGIALMLLSAACAGDAVQAARAIVKGPESRLLDFHQNLLGYLSTDNLDEAAIICDRSDDRTKPCDKLSPTGTETKTLTYVFFRDYERLEAFALAWGKVQTKAPSKIFTLMFDGDFTTSVCTPPQVPQPCVTAPFCRLTPGCDEKSGPPCTKCDGVP